MNATWPTARVIREFQQRHNDSKNIVLIYMDRSCPIGFFCFDTQTAGLIIAISVLFIGFHAFYKKTNIDTLNQMKKEKYQILENRINQLENNKIVVVSPPPTVDAMLVNKDFERIVNPLLPPERSFNSTYRVPINMPTRGFSDNYQQVGAINSGDKILPLFGRPRWPGASRWNYYTSTDSFQSVKLPVNFKNRNCLDEIGCDEVYDGDAVGIPQFGQDREFKANIYRLDKPFYLPFR